LTCMLLVSLQQRPPPVRLVWL